MKRPQVSEEDFAWFYSPWFFPGTRLNRAMKRFPVVSASADGLLTHSNNLMVVGFDYTEMTGPVHAHIFIAAGCWTTNEKPRAKSTFGTKLANKYLKLCPEGCFIGCLSTHKAPGAAAATICEQLAQGKTAAQAIRAEHNRSYYRSIWAAHEAPWQVIGDSEMTLERARKLFQASVSSG